MLLLDLRVAAGTGSHLESQGIWIRNGSSTGQRARAGPHPPTRHHHLCAHVPPLTAVKLTRGQVRMREVHMEALKGDHGSDHGSPVMGETQTTPRNEGTSVQNQLPGTDF